MTKKNISLVALVLLLAGLSLYLNRDRFESAPIQISHRSMPPRVRPSRRRPANPALSDPVIFLISKDLRLTSIKVVLAADSATNKYPHALWELVGNPRSVPVNQFRYGMNIRGMKPAVRRAFPEPLRPGVKYELLVKAGSFKGEHDFVPIAQGQ